MESSVSVLPKKINEKSSEIKFIQNFQNKALIIQTLCEGPRRMSYLKRITGLSTRSIYRIIANLQENGFTISHEDMLFKIVAVPFFFTETISSLLSSITSLKK